MNKTYFTAMMMIALAALASGCTKTADSSKASSDVAPATLKANSDMAQSLKLNDQRDLEDAKRGFLAQAHWQSAGSRRHRAA
jgi:alkyl sulfatase BDS1-like metallo-beta-lactamase superfamily hydrolase